MIVANCVFSSRHFGDCATAVAQNDYNRRQNGPDKNASLVLNVIDDLNPSRRAQDLSTTHAERRWTILLPRVSSHEKGL